MGELKKLLGYLGPYRRDMILAGLLVLIETAFELFIPVLMADIIDVGVAARDTLKVCGKWSPRPMLRFFWEPALRN